MPEIYLKNKGKNIEAEKFETGGVNYLAIFLKFLEDELKFLFENENLDIELNLVTYGHLGSELLYDERLKKDFLKKDLESLNKYSGIAVYYLGVYGDLLLEEYREEKICYIALKQVPIFNMMRLTYHELNHFLDPFPIKEWQEGLGSGISYINFDKTIGAGVRLGLNEYYANFYSYASILYLIKRLEGKIGKSSIEISIEYITATSLSYLSNLDIHLIEFVDGLKGKDLTDSNIQAEIIKFFSFDFFKEIYYFLGAWRGYLKEDLNTDSFQEIWNQFLKRLEESKFNETNKFLEKFKSTTLNGFKFRNKKIVLRYVELLFLNFFHKKLLAEIREIFNPKIKEDWSFNNFIDFSEIARQMMKPMVEPIRKVSDFNNVFFRNLLNINWFDLEKESDDSNDSKI